MTTATVSLSPAEGLLARQISYWINVSAEGRGGSKDHLGRGWTYLSAEDLQGRVLDYDTVELSIPTIYRALRSLVKKGWFIREKLQSHRWWHVFHYTYGANHPSNFTSNGVDQVGQTDVIKAITSKTETLPYSSSSKSLKPVANAPGTTEQPQPNSINKERSTTERVGFEPAVVAQPLTAIADAAPPALLEQLTAIEANYRKQLESLNSSEMSPVAVEEPPGVPELEGCRNPTHFTPSPSQSNVVSPEHGVMNPTLEPIDARDYKSTDAEKALVTLDSGSSESKTRRAHNPKVGNTWDRIRALAGQFNASAVETVSPKALITKNGQRLRVDDGITSPLR
ncbi:hypothetical protein OAA10_00365 [bacterium]|nr:hypothetical protein [bacterium]